MKGLRPMTNEELDLAKKYQQQLKKARRNHATAQERALLEQLDGESWYIRDFARNPDNYYSDGTRIDSGW